MPHKDKEVYKAYQKKWAQDNKDKTRKYVKDYLERNPAKKMWKSSIQNAKTRGLDNTITDKDIIIPTHCPYLGIELTSKVEKKNTPSTMSLDRIDNTKGYIPGNIQVISNLANLMKSFATEEQLITFAKSVLRIHEKT